MNSYQPSDPPLSGLCAVNRDAKVTMGSSTFNTVVVVSFDFAKSNRLSIQFSISNGEVVPFELIDTADIWFSGSDCPFRAEVSSRKIKSNGETLFQMYPKVSVWAGDESGAISIRVYLANFGEHFSKWKEVSFQDDRFRWCLEPLSDREKETFSPCETEGTRVGQSATLKALDGSAISQGDREEQIRSLQLFLSFCQGGWVSPFLVEGTDKNGTTCFQQWQDTLLSTFREHGRGWLDRSIIQQLSLVWPGFIAIRKNPIWAESVRLCLYWFLRGDTENVGPDGALILLQAAFERLAWHVLVIDEQKLTEKQFKNSRENPAHKKLRMLLEGMGIPTGIPETLKSLVEYAKLHGAANGPETLTRIRNSLVHPQESESKAKVPVAEGYFLARHYLQLCLLNKFGHTGSFRPWTALPIWVGTVEPVPWSEAAGCPESRS